MVGRLKFFSKGGKEVVLKSVAIALPNHVMFCYRIPKAVISKLTSALACFWWRSGGNARGMHWKSWTNSASVKMKEV